MRWLWMLLPRKLRPPAPNGEAAQAADTARRKLREAQGDWPDVHTARDDLASWLNTAMGRGK